MCSSKIINSDNRYNLCWSQIKDQCKYGLYYDSGLGINADMAYINPILKINFHKLTKKKVGEKTSENQTKKYSQLAACDY